MTRVLVLGRAGQLAQALAAAVPPAGWTLEFAGRERLDLTRPETVATVIDAAAPDVVINTAAYTAVDRAETQRDLAFAVNAGSAGAAAEAATRAGALFVQLSTDYVFDGRKGAPYGEDDPVAPLQVYGASKAEGERRVLAAAPDAQVVRTAWLISGRGRNFATAIAARWLAGERLDVVDDQRGRPTSADDLADLLLKICAARLAGRGAAGRLHVANAGEATWRELALAVAGALSAPARPDPRRIRAVTTAAYGAPAPRPADSRLDLSRLERVFGLRPRPWPEALDSVMELIRPRPKVAPKSVETRQHSSARTPFAGTGDL